MLHQPDYCPNCTSNEEQQQQLPSRSHFRLHPTLSVYRNRQRWNLQETPGSVPPGRVPRTKEILIADDLIDAARPGEEVEITGIYQHSFDHSMTIKSGFPVFATHITANHVCKREDASSAANLSESDIRQILELARDPHIGDRIVQSMAPSIFGHDFCKTALAMSLFGGVAIMLGAELGTCSDTLLATIKGSRQALKTGLFHITFNLLSIILGLLLFYPFVQFVSYISAGASIERTLANAHMLFNILGVLIFVWTIPLFEKLLNKMLPDKTEEQLAQQQLEKVQKINRKNQLPQH